MTEKKNSSGGRPCLRYVVEAEAVSGVLACTGRSQVIVGLLESLYQPFRRRYGTCVDRYANGERGEGGHVMKVRRRTFKGRRASKFHAKFQRGGTNHHT